MKVLGERGRTAKRTCPLVFVLLRFFFFFFFCFFDIRAAPEVQVIRECFVLDSARHFVQGSRAKRSLSLALLDTAQPYS